jgi:hypothetical protein
MSVTTITTLQTKYEEDVKATGTIAGFGLPDKIIVTGQTIKVYKPETSTKKIEKKLNARAKTKEELQIILNEIDDASDDVFDFVYKKNNKDTVLFTVSSKKDAKEFLLSGLNTAYNETYDNKATDSAKTKTIKEFFNEYLSKVPEAEPEGAGAITGGAGAMSETEPEGDEAPMSETEPEGAGASVPAGEIPGAEGATGEPEGATGEPEGAGASVPAGEIPGGEDERKGEEGAIGETLPPPPPLTLESVPSYSTAGKSFYTAPIIPEEQAIQEIKETQDDPKAGVSSIDLLKVGSDSDKELKEAGILYPELVRQIFTDSSFLREFDNFKRSAEYKQMTAGNQRETYNKAQELLNIYQDQFRLVGGLKVSYADNKKLLDQQLAELHTLAVGVKKNLAGGKKGADPLKNFDSVGVLIDISSFGMSLADLIKYMEARGLSAESSQGLTTEGLKGFQKPVDLGDISMDVKDEQKKLQGEPDKKLKKVDQSKGLNFVGNHDTIVGDKPSGAKSELEQPKNMMSGGFKLMKKEKKVKKILVCL